MFRPYKGPEASRKKSGMQNPSLVPAKLGTVERPRELGPYQGSETSRKRSGMRDPSPVPAKLRTVERSDSGAGPRDRLAPLHARPPDALTGSHKQSLFG